MRRFICRLLASILVLAATAAIPVAAPGPAYALDDGLALTPPMGFNNWNATHCDETFNEEMIVAIADIIVEQGLKDVGYEYVNIDDCWARPQNSPEGSRDADGRLVPDPERFPRGISWLADYVHSKGLKFGIYTSAGTRTCNGQGFDGALGYEEIDAQTFAEWGVDYLKYDNCNNQGVPAIERYPAMRDALQATGRPIVYSITEWGQNEPWLWAADVGHLWRTTGDISDNYGSMLSIMKRNAALDAYAGPGHWNDPDMLEVGNGGMTNIEYRSHFSLWSIMAAPLLIGADLREVDPEAFEILRNREVIAVNQDPLGVQGKVLSSDGGKWVFAKPLAGGDVAVALFNENPHPTAIGTTAEAVGLPERRGYVLHDLWQGGRTHTAGGIAAQVPAHGTVMYRVSTDRGWLRYPPAVSFRASADTPGQGTAGQYLAPGAPVEVEAALTNHGRLPAYLPALALTGPVAYEGVSYEAEAPPHTYSGAVGTASCGGCSGGTKVRYIGNTPDNWLRLDGVTVPADGRYQLTIHATVDGARTFQVSVNDGPGVAVPVTGSSWSAPVTATLEVELSAGTNTIRFFNDDAWAPDLDRVVVTGTASLEGWTVEPARPVTGWLLRGGRSLTGHWTVTPPAGAAPGTYELLATGSYRAHGERHSMESQIRLVVPGTPPLASGYLSGQQWLEATNGWGPVELDMSNGERAAGDGGTISIGGVAYPKGLGVHAPGEILYLTAGRCSSLMADVGVDDEVRDNQSGSVSFEIWGDSTKLADSGVVTWQDQPQTLTADITGAAFVRLVVTDTGDGTNSDHADWAEARITCPDHLR